MAGNVCKLGTFIRRVANWGGHKGEFIFRKIRQTLDLLFFVRNL